MYRGDPQLPGLQVHEEVDIVLEAAHHLFDVVALRAHEIAEGDLAELLRVDGEVRAELIEARERELHLRLFGMA